MFLSTTCPQTVCENTVSPSLGNALSSPHGRIMGSRNQIEFHNQVKEWLYSENMYSFNNTVAKLW